MKKIIYTQRVEIVESYGGRRDCADVEIAKLIWECGFLPVSVNNIPDTSVSGADQARWNDSYRRKRPVKVWWKCT
jgi:putative glutamine amidotransferase